MQLYKMKDLHVTTMEEFYQEAASYLGKDTEALLPAGIQKDVGHFNVFDIFQTIQDVRHKNTMPYNRRTYYKISLIKGRNRAEYADKVIQVKKNGLLFASPRIPYRWVPEDEDQGGTFCVFTADFMQKRKSGIDLDTLPLLQPGGYPIFELSDEDATEASLIFKKIKQEISSDYAFKYDLLRNYVSQLLHFGQKLQPAAAIAAKVDSGSRVLGLFVELLERQFPVESIAQRLLLRSAKDYADQLAIHVNYLNKIVKERTGLTTTQVINKRVINEGKILLKQTDWTVSEIAFTLGFEEVAHFSNAFKKQTLLSPQNFRV